MLLYAVQGFSNPLQAHHRGPHLGTGPARSLGRPDCMGHSPGRRKGKQRQAQLFSPGLHPHPSVPKQRPQEQARRVACLIPMLQMREPRPFERAGELLFMLLSAPDPCSPCKLPHQLGHSADIPLPQSREG